MKKSREREREIKNTLQSVRDGKSQHKVFKDEKQTRVVEMGGVTLDKISERRFGFPISTNNLFHFFSLNFTLLIATVYAKTFIMKNIQLISKL